MMRVAMEEPANRFTDFVPEGASVLEVGCSSGYFMAALQDRKYDVLGNEWNPEDAAFVRDVGELPCEEGDLTEVYPGKTFTAIAALQVLEHQADPLEFLRQIKSRLIGGGYLYLELPHAGDTLLTAWGMKEVQDFWYRDCHITYWDIETLVAVLGALGFQAKVTTRQRYGLRSHINWYNTKKPLSNFKDATEYWAPIPSVHPLSGVINRATMKLDKEYRTNLESMKGGDTLVACCRRVEI